MSISPASALPFRLPDSPITRDKVFIRIKGEDGSIRSECFCGEWARHTTPEMVAHRQGRGLVNTDVTQRENDHLGRCHNNGPGDVYDLWKRGWPAHKPAAASTLVVAAAKKRSAVQDFAPHAKSNKAESAELERVRAELDALNTRLTTENARLTTDIEGLVREARQLAIAREAESKELERLKAQMDELSTNNSELLSKNRCLTDENARLSTKIEVVVREAKQNAITHRQSTLKLQRECSQLKTECRTTNDQLIKALEKCVELQKESAAGTDGCICSWRMPADAHLTARARSAMLKQVLTVGHPDKKRRAQEGMSEDEAAAIDNAMTRLTQNINHWRKLE